jgi:hypothetical protein
MRRLAFVFVAFAALTGTLVGCGGSPRKPGATGKAGTGGSAGTGAAGTTGTAGTGAAGDGAAGAGAAGTGAAGDGAAGTGAAGTGAAGTGAAGTGAAGTTGAAGAPPPPCDAMPKKSLPYDIGTDYAPVIINGNTNQNAWVIVDSPSCDTTTFPPLNPAPDGGADGGDGGTDAGTSDAASDGSAATEGGTDAGTDTSDDATATLQLDDPDAGDGGVVDAPQDVPVGSDAAVDAAADSGVKDGGADGGGSDAAAKPACFEMTYNPDPCVTSMGGTGNCWGGAIFSPMGGALGNTAPGICIAPGATKVTFMARASKDGARIKFGAIGAGEGSTEFFINLTTAWAQYSIASPAATDYNLSTTQGGVWNGFSVVAEAPDHAGGTYIFVKDITWVTQ